jgi:hypothetical protein
LISFSGSYKKIYAIYFRSPFFLAQYQPEIKNTQAMATLVANSRAATEKSPNKKKNIDHLPTRM